MLMPDIDLLLIIGKTSMEVGKKISRVQSVWTAGAMCMLLGGRKVICSEKVELR
jgi:hypothetical protein